jgi:CRP/FNR family transcriptional regulator, cyclic AMP receptor protein
MKVSGLFRNAKDTRTVPAGTVIFHEGDAGTEMFGIVSGEVELRVGDNLIATLHADDVFGEMALIDSSQRMATAMAAADTVLSVIDRRHFLFLVHETPMFALQVMSALAARLRELETHQN